SFDLSTASLIGQGEITSGVEAKVEVHVLDLYNRNPTSSDDRIFVREAWVSFGRHVAPFEPVEGFTGYALAGLAPRFSKQLTRRLESYGLWGTAVGRFEQPQIQVGGTLGPNVYFRGMVGNGNPLFFRDPNALAGDNGTPERVPGNVHPIYQSGFPILYDAKPTDLNFRGRFEWGAGIGARIGRGERASAEALAWYFARTLADSVALRGTFYSGDLKLLEFGFPLPVSGNKKHEFGVNLEGKAGGGHLFGQYVSQDIAGLKRDGIEAELAYRIKLNGLFLLGESPVGNWIQPAFRASTINNKFVTPLQYPGPSVGWDWRKYDFGLRFGIVRDVDLTAEYALNVVLTRLGTLHPNETLVTLRVGF
ncbi:MAG TPA: hypothetical protein VN083_10130, partial [Vicinamibacteria bacterium]|nr:hypothetical protein [Vicinamibacteria bacterium]